MLQSTTQSPIVQEMKDDLKKLSIYFSKRVSIKEQLVNHIEVTDVENWLRILEDVGVERSFVENVELMAANQVDGFLKHVVKCDNDV